MSRKIIILIVLLMVTAILLAGSLFTVDETEQGIVTQLGKYVRTVTEPGLHLKVPFIQSVHKFEDRILEYDASAAKIITSDKKHLDLDNYARWRIVEPLKLYQTVRNELGASARLDDIVFSEIREELARHTLTEIVSVNRASIMEKVGKKCDAKAREYGVEVIDVRIKRADLPLEVRDSVYARMRAERQRQAKKYRSEGEEEAVKIRAITDKERTILLAESYRQAEKLKGEGDAAAIKIYAEAFEKDPEFYTFVRTLEAYEKSLRQDTTVVLPSDSEFFQYLSPPTK
ncbi:MAG TPA: protease modulator HflC [Sedimentisphaerales bacterium]|nr:protease modulator HflC [Sedimentisphaerales bacterium]